jgi:hypothetical protein
MNTALVIKDYTLTEQQRSIVNRSVETGDLSGLTSQDRANYYYAMCDRYGLDPLSRPFDYIESREKKDNNWIKKLAIYPNQKAGAQMRRIHGITITIVSRENQGDVFVVVARATRRDGSSDEAMGVVSLIGYEDKPLTGNQKANAMMKAEGKARQRATMAVCGLLSSEGDEELGNDRVIRSEALDGGLEPEVIEGALIPDGIALSEKISVKIQETGLTSKAIAAMLKENNLDPKAVDDLPVEQHDRVLKLIDALAGNAA